MPPQSSSPGHRLNALLIPLIVLIVLFLGVCGFAVWAFLERNDFKDNVDSKIDAAVTVAIQEESSRKETEFIEREKEPNKSFVGPSAYGSVGFDFPKTWSGHVIEKDRTTVQVEGYFHPDVVPDVNGETAFALRIQVIDRQYADVLDSFASKARTGKVKVTAYAAKNVEGVVGSKIVGEVNPDQKDTLVLLPLRDKTLQIWTESDSFVGDFNKIILESLTFVP